MRKAYRFLALTAAAMLLFACGGAPFASLGRRSSDWISEPTIVTTTTVPITVPSVIRSDVLRWFNDTIVTTAPLDNPVAVEDEIFARRAGDLFIQASRAEMLAILPEIRFPATVPFLAEYVTSQVVFDNDGELSSDPVATFGIWSSEPYTRSRSVAQLAVLEISSDPEAAAALQQPDGDVSCARFADRTTAVCESFSVEGRPIWSLTADNGTTLVWFEGIYRYELFGRSFVPLQTLQQMAVESVALADLEPLGG
ncbi:MAG TPA: hypothetical protein VI193_00180 [Acidimicrobiia bacterium]